MQESKPKKSIYDNSKTILYMHHIKTMGIVKFIEKNSTYTYTVDKYQTKMIFALKKMSMFTKQECYYLLAPFSDTVKQIIDSGYNLDNVKQYIRSELAPMMHIYNLE